MLLLAAVRPTSEYSSEIWEANKGQAAALESVVLGAKCILWCSLHSVISNRDINLSARRSLLVAVVRPILEYDSEVWEANKAQAAALESVVLGGTNPVLGCSSRTCNEAIRVNMGLDSLQGRISGR